MEKKVKVSHGRVLLKHVDTTRKSGIIVNEDLNAPGTAEVIRVFDGKRDIYWPNEGDIVLYNRTNTIKLELDGVQYFLTTERDIYCVFENKITK